MVLYAWHSQNGPFATLLKSQILPLCSRKLLNSEFKVKVKGQFQVSTADRGHWDLNWVNGVAKNRTIGLELSSIITLAES